MSTYHRPEWRVLSWRDRWAFAVSTLVGVVVTIFLSPVFLVLFVAQWVARFRG